jgi:hypothetical protein
MSYSTYQNKAWEIMEKKVKQMKETGDSNLAEQLQAIMSESASEAFKKPTSTKEIAGLLMDSVNSSAFDDEEFATVVAERTHRTLQQSFFRAIMACVKKWDERNKEGWFDLRNEATVKASSKIKEALKDDYFPLV